MSSHWLADEWRKRVEELRAQDQDETGELELVPFAEVFDRQIVRQAECVAALPEGRRRDEAETELASLRSRLAADELYLREVGLVFARRKKSD
jgi:hypothetical protein